MPDHPIQPIPNDIPPRTALWAQLSALKQKAKAEGMLPEPLSWDEILAEVARRRGEERSSVRTKRRKVPIMNAFIIRTTVPSDHRLPLPEELPTGCTIEVTVRPIVEGDVVDTYQPRTELGRRLLELRRIYVQSGGKLASWEELDDEMRERRGSVAGD